MDYIIPMDDKISDIKLFLKDIHTDYIDINNDTSINNIHKLLLNNILFEPIQEIEYLYLGIYHEYVTNNYDEMKKYYNICINNKNDIAMYNLACYYHSINNYDEMKKYYLLSIEHGNIRSVNNLGHYYYDIKNYDEMKKYYLIGVSNNIYQSSNGLSLYYQKIHDYKKSHMYSVISINIYNCDNNVAFRNAYAYYWNNTMHIKLLEYFLNFQNIVTELEIIELCNNIISRKMTDYQLLVFKQLLRECNIDITNKNFNNINNKNINKKLKNIIIQL